MKITIFGDICPTSDTLQKFVNGDTEGLFHELLPLMHESDLVIGNLECSLTDNPKPIQKAGPVLYAPTATALTLRKAGFDILSLANNHIRDCGEDGVISTINTCKKRGISTFGAGENITQAKKPLIVEADNHKIGLLSFAEHEFNYATENRAGASTLDVYSDFDAIRKFRKQVDILIVLYHGGIEYHPYPSPQLAKRCRKIVECGVDLVLCQHSHCIGSIENIGSSVIVYGQGNSIFGYRNNDNNWNSGMVLTATISENQIKIEHRMIQMCHDGLHYMENDQSKKWLDLLESRNVHLSDSDYIYNKWIQFCLKNQSLNLPLLLGWKRPTIALNRRLKNFFINLLYSKKRANISHNMLRCESHLEVIDTILSQYDYN